MEKTLIQKAIHKKYNIYDKNGVRNSLKKFIKDFNSFVSINDRPPIDSRKEEHSLFMRWTNFRKLENLNEAELEYIDKFMFKIEAVGSPLLKFVKEYNKFVETYGREPRTTGNSEEMSIYRRWYYYNNAENLTEDEIEYLKENGIINTDNIRLKIKKFVKDLNEFVKVNKRYPTGGKEKTLYRMVKVYTNPKNLSKEEYEYVQQNLIKNDNIRELIKRFVKKYKDFVKNNNRKPRYDSSGKDECNLYKTYHRYTDARNLNKEEITYLEKHGFIVKGLNTKKDINLEK